MSLCHNSDFLITISLEPNVVDLRYFKLYILLDQIIKIWLCTWLSRYRDRQFEFVTKAQILWESLTLQRLWTWIKWPSLFTVIFVYLKNISVNEINGLKGTIVNWTCSRLKRCCFNHFWHLSNVLIKHIIMMNKNIKKLTHLQHHQREERVPPVQTRILSTQILFCSILK